MSDSFFEIKSLKKPKSVRTSIFFFGIHSIARKINRKSLRVLKNNTGWSRLLVAPGWDAAGPLVSDALFSAVKFWLIAVPIVAGLVSAFPIYFSAPGFDLVVGEDFSAPLSFKVSFLSAFFILMAIIVYRLYCPSIVKENPHPSAIVSMVEEEAASLFRELVLEGMPRQVMVEGKSIFRPLGSFFRSGEFRTLMESEPTSDIYEYEFMPILGKLSSELLTQDQLGLIYNRNFHLGVVESNKMLLGDTFLRGDGKKRNPGSIINQKLENESIDFDATFNASIDDIYASQKLYRGSYELYRTLLMDTKIPDSMLPYLFRAAARSRVITRSVFWVLYGVGFLLAVYVVSDMIARGFMTLFG